MAIFLDGFENIKPVKWQLAQNGIWEEAQSLRIGESFNVTSWVELADRDVALECFFHTDKEEIVFLGIRLKKLEKAQQALLIEHLFANIHQAMPFKDILKVYSEIFEIPHFLETKPNFMELGAEGFWKSYGSYVVWDENSQFPKTLEDIEKNAPQILQNFKRPMMLEFAWNDPYPVWLGVQVSDKLSEEMYCFSENKYKNLFFFL